MIKKITIGFGISFLALGMCLLVINLNNSTVEAGLSKSNSSITSSNNSSNIKTISSSVDMLNYSVEDLNSFSDSIVKGKAIEQSYYTVKDQVYSKTKIKIEKVYKGNANKEGTLNIVEYGGITTEDEYLLPILEEKTGKKPTEEQKNKAKLNKLRVLEADIPYSEIGKSSIYFLRKATTDQFDNQIENNTYTPIGIQGRFDIKEGNTFERPRGNCLPELIITEMDLEKVIKSR